MAAGGFQPVVNYPTCQAPAAIAAADFDRDGTTDLAIACGTGGVTILLGNHDGTFQPGVGYGTSWQASALTAGDFNGDGVADLAVSIPGQIAILLGKGDGTFQLPSTFAFTSAPWSPTVIDANSDGIADLLTLNPDSYTVSVLLGKATAPSRQRLNTPWVPPATRRRTWQWGTSTGTAVPILRSLLAARTGPFRY